MEILALVKELLYRQKFTIKGARQYLKSKGVGKALEEKAQREESDHSLFLQDLNKKIEKLAERTDHVLETLERE